MFKIEKNYIKNHKEIINYVESRNFVFKHRSAPQSTAKTSSFMTCPGVTLKSKMGNSDFYTLFNEDMDDHLLNLILENVPKELVITNKFIQIQKYNPGNYILPHKDFQQVTRISKLHLYTLTTSDHDGLVCECNDKYILIPDEAGQHIDGSAAMFNWHWVNPVRKLRYSMVIGV